MVSPHRRRKGMNDLLGCLCCKCGSDIRIGEGEHYCPNCTPSAAPVSEDIITAAKAVLEKADENLDAKTAPFKWVCPWEELTALRAALHHPSQQPTEGG